MDKIKVSKFLVGVVVASGVTRIVNGIVRNNVNPVTFWQKATTLAGSLVIGSIVAGAAKNETDAIIDTIVENYHSAVAVANKILNRS